MQKRLTHDFRTGVRKVRREGLGTGVGREVNRTESRARKVQNGGRDCWRKSNWYFHANNQIIGLKRKSQA